MRSFDSLSTAKPTSSANEQKASGSTVLQAANSPNKIQSRTEKGWCEVEMDEKV
jgi:hypothetical protein